MQHARRRAFTLIEVLMVIGVIVILATLLLVGTRSLLATNKARATKVTLAAQSGMLAELDAKTRLTKSPLQWLWSEAVGLSVQPSTVTLLNGTQLQVDFWRIPYSLPGDPLRERDAMDAPTGVGEEFATNHFGSKAVLNTQIVMGMLLAMPNNRTALGSLSNSLQMTPDWTSGKLESMSASGGLLGSADNEDVTYLQGMRVRASTSADQPPQQYICMADHVVTAGTDFSADQSNWVLDQTGAAGATPGAAAGAGAAPILLDGWGNPIIFVPGTGLRVRLLNGKGRYDDPTGSDKSQVFIITSPEGKVNRNSLTEPPYVVQAGRPFFASAGPDGDFSKGDDNIYSFQQ